MEANIIWEDVYQRIRETSALLGVDLHTIAELLGLDPRSEDYRKQRNKLPKMLTVMQVSSILGVPASWLLYGIGKPPQLSISDTVDSTVLQGNTAGTLIVNSGTPQLSEHKRELMRIFDALPLRKQIKLLSEAYALEDCSIRNRSRRRASR